jgi:hypothetical protein
MCGKPHQKGFRTVLHSDTVCRAVSDLQTAGFRAALGAQRKSDVSRHYAIGDTKAGQSIFGGLPRQTAFSVPSLSAYVYQKAVSLVPANLFMMFAPLEGWRHVKCTDRHTAVDYAQILKELSDIHFPNAVKIVLVQDNLNTHKPASLYEAFPAAEARRLVERFEWHYTPKHGSWLDMAESELSVLSSQCLDRRIPDKQTLIDEVDAWQNRRNKNHAKADWQFTTADARIKLKHLYPSI